MTNTARFELLTALLLGCAACGPALSMELTIDRLFDAPSLAGPAIVGLKISPDSSRVTFLQGRADDKNRLDLWEYNLRDRVARLLVDADKVAPPGAPLSDEEKARRERQRTAQLSGILEYEFAPSGKGLVFPSGRNLYYYDLTHPVQALRQLTHSNAAETDPKVSPLGSFTAYVRDQNLFVFDFAQGRERAITHDGGGTIKNGMAEFVAQEEMHRSTGYWWSPDDRHIAFARIDESPVSLTQRFEIEADEVSTFAQRYPAAGTANALVQLGVVDVADGTERWLDLGDDKDIYLARVDWLPGGKTLAVQRQSRDQRRLDLIFFDIASGSSRTVLSETSPTWTELHDELTLLKQSSEFIWASDRSGYRHLYLYGDDGRLIRQLTEGKWVVDDFDSRAIEAVDEAHRLVYFTATEKHPTERHLYVTSLDHGPGRTPQRISSEEGVHSIAMSRDARFYVDQFSSPRQPLQVSIKDNRGELIAYLQENRVDANHPYAPYVSSESVPQFGALTAEDGQELEYRIFKPRDFDASRHYPVIIEVYGGPGVQRVLKNWTGDSFTQILTRAGYVVFQLDNRGSAFRGVRFQSPIHGKLGEIEVRDQVLGARWLVAQPFVDAKRIGVWGWSYGGYMSLMLMFKAPEVFRAAVAGAPVTGWTLYDTHYTERYLGRPQVNPVGYAQSAVFDYAKNLDGPLLIMHGMADDNVLFLNSTKLFRKLQDLGKPFDIMTYPGGKHGLTRTHDGRHADATIKRFFDEHLSGAAKTQSASSP